MLVDLLWQKHTWILDRQFQLSYPRYLAQPPSGDPGRTVPTVELWGSRGIAENSEWIKTKVGT